MYPKPLEPVLFNKRPVQVLVIVYENPGIHQTTIASTLNLWPSQVGQILKRLKNEGLVISKSHRKEMHCPGAILKYATSEKGDKVASHLAPLIKLFYPDEPLQVKEDSPAPEASA
jgi:transcription initiation factor IIE alpha subunit